MNDRLTQAARLIDSIRSRMTVASGAEITVEANPEDVTIETVSAWRLAGVNRLEAALTSLYTRIAAGLP